MDFFGKYFSRWPELLEQFEKFKKKHELRIIQELKRLKNQNDFLSKITEIHFGLFFDKLCTSIYYNERLNGKTPDWTIVMNGQKIIAEVARLNPSESDNQKLSFENEFMNAMHEIQVGCLISFDYDEHNNDIKIVDILRCKRGLERWLEEKRSPGDRITLSNCIEIEFLKYNNDWEDVCMNGGGGTIRYNYKRLNSQNSALLKKVNRYTKEILAFDLPYIICIYMDPHSWFKKDDLFTTLYGHSIEPWGNVTYHSHSLEKALYYCHLNEKNLYYSIRDNIRHVTGILFTAARTVYILP